MPLLPGSSHGGGDPLLSKIRERWQVDDVGTVAGVTVTKAANTDFLHTCTGIQCTGDAAALVTIEAPAATILWRKRFSSAFAHSEVFPPGLIRGAVNQALLVKISASTANCEANMQGLTVESV